MIDHVKQQLEKMRAQEVALQSEYERIAEQLTMTRGAIQALQHTLETFEGAAAFPPPDEEGKTLARK
jgi:prefoldin subunit 5